MTCVRLLIPRRNNLERRILLMLTLVKNQIYAKLLQSYYRMQVVYVVLMMVEFGVVVVVVVP